MRKLRGLSLEARKKLVSLNDAKVSLGSTVSLACQLYQDSVNLKLEGWAVGEGVTNGGDQGLAELRNSFLFAFGGSYFIDR